MGFPSVGTPSTQLKDTSEEGAIRGSQSLSKNLNSQMNVNIVNNMEHVLGKQGRTSIVEFRLRTAWLFSKVAHYCRNQKPKIAS